MTLRWAKWWPSQTFAARCRSANGGGGVGERRRVALRAGGGKRGAVVWGGEPVALNGGVAVRHVRGVPGVAPGAVSYGEVSGP